MFPWVMSTHRSNNPAHYILKNLLRLEVGSELQTLIIDQIHDSKLLIDGLHPDPSSMVPRLQQIIAAVLEHASH
jgi:hypothetical protein